MKNHMITTTTLCALLFSNVSNAESSTQLTTKKDTQKTISTVADVMSDTNISVDITMGFIDSFAIMGDCQEGQKARKEIESKRDLATKEIQDESKRFEKAKNDYIAKSTTMSDSAREKEEKQLMKMERD